MGPDGSAASACNSPGGAARPRTRLGGTDPWASPCHRRILFASPVPWNGLRQRHQALATGLARRGFAVTFLNPLEGGGWGVRITPQEAGLVEVAVRVPFRATGFPGLQAVAVRLAGRLLRGAGLAGSQTLLWVGDPSLAGLAGPTSKMGGMGGARGGRPSQPPRRLDGALSRGPSPAEKQAGAQPGGNISRDPSWRGVIYDRCDLHGEFPGQRARTWNGYEALLFARADLILATSPVLLAGFPSATRATRLLVPNAVEPGMLDPGAVPRPAAPPLRLLSAGAHFEWIDFSWLERLAAVPGLELHLAGPGRGEDFRRLTGRPGVFDHGVLSHAALRGLMDACHVGLVPFRDLPLAKAIDPIKAYEYAARGLKVWGTDLPSLRSHPYVDRVVATEEIDGILLREIGSSSQKSSRKVPPPTWDDRLESIFPALERLGS